ncbi:MAG: glycosyltransferase [Bacilli bacterium]|nr:glycosyltransferase [Bacilli bacterium]
MNKYKVCVYAICKNESKFIERWVKSMREADEIYVFDTGSDDGSVELLQKLGVNVKSEVIKPWRFDVARNKSLDMVPLDTDICVCTDIDEVFEAGWREKLEAIWNENVCKVKYNYHWSFDENGNPATTFYIEKIHRRDGYKWVHPVHEVLNVIDGEVSVLAPNITLNHYPDAEKSRSSYLPLLELSVKEEPEDDRNMHYLGREYMYYGKYNEAIDTLIRHLSLPRATWDAERCASMRFIARCYMSLNRPKEAEMWLQDAIKEASYLRESYVELAQLYVNQNRYNEAYELLNKAFLIKEKAPIYINEAFAWNEYIYELMGIVCFNLKLYPESLSYMGEALKLNEKSERIKNNYDFINKTINGDI